MGHKNKATNWTHSKAEQGSSSHRDSRGVTVVFIWFEKQLLDRESMLSESPGGGNFFSKNIIVNFVGEKTTQPVLGVLAHIAQSSTVVSSSKLIYKQEAGLGLVFFLFFCFF